MAGDLDKYRAYTFQIAGFCLMTPLGKLILNVPEYELCDLNTKFFIFLIFSLILFYFGMIFIFKGGKYLEGENYKWTYK